MSNNVKYNVPRVQITCPDGSPGVMVAGGLAYDPAVGAQYTTEILNLRSLAWEEGPALPAPLVGGALLHFNGTVLAVGGVNSDLIHELDLEEWVWVERKERLPRPRSSFVAGLAPRRLLDMVGGGR